MKYPIVILHGWRLSGSRYGALQEIFEKKGYTVYAPDLPGFGNEKVTQDITDLQSYTSFVKKFFHDHNINKAIIIGHSFGGRIAAKFTALYPKMVEKLILTGAPLIKQPLAPKKKIIVYLAKIGKGIFQLIHIDYKNMRKIVYFLLGEWDYYKSNNMREIFLNIIKEDVAPNLPFIRTPTFLLWGVNDTFVSKKIGKEIAKKMPHATYKEIPSATHKLPYEQPEIFAKEVLRFIT